MITVESDMNSIRIYWLKILMNEKPAEKGLEEWQLSKSITEIQESTYENH